VYPSKIKLKSKKEIKKRHKMTCIIGSKCNDGVALIADKKIIDEGTNWVEYKEKLFIFKIDSFYYPIVIGFSGTLPLYEKFKREAIATLAQINPTPAGYSPVGYGFGYSTSGTIYPFTPMNSTSQGKEVHLYDYIKILEDIVKNYNKEYRHEKFDVLFSAQVKYSGAVLIHIPNDGLSDDIHEYKVIGSGGIPATTFLKNLDPNNMTMNQFAKWGFFIIKYIEEKGIDNQVGVGQHKPQIYFIPNEEHLYQADDNFLNECEYSKGIMDKNFKKILPE
jgi:20S proteasome alpha/beta subunit